MEEKGDKTTTMPMNHDALLLEVMDHQNSQVASESSSREYDAAESDAWMKQLQQEIDRFQQNSADQSNQEAFEDDDEEEDEDDRSVHRSWATETSATNSQHAHEQQHDHHEDVDGSVQAALDILNDYDEKENDPLHVDMELQREGEQRLVNEAGWRSTGKPYYYDLVHEAMEVMWDANANRFEHQDPEDHESTENEHNESLEEENLRDDQQNHKNETSSSNQSSIPDPREYNEDHASQEDNQEIEEAAIQQDQQAPQDNGAIAAATEWKEAYTAKGRVYYYNRRTRESSWIKPKGYKSPVAHESPETKTNNNQERHDSQSFEDQAFLYCCFCGQQQFGNDYLHHFRSCRVLEHHKAASSPLYHRFQEMLCLLSEDATLRSLHYPTSFLTASPSPDTRSSMQDGLRTLRQRQRNHQQNSEEESNAAPARSLKAMASHTKETPSTRYNSLRAKPSARAVQTMETCRHCRRSFAEGRLFKHEAVCPRVFGNEATWGKAVSSRSLSTAATGPASSVSPLKLHLVNRPQQQPNKVARQSTIKTPRTPVNRSTSGDYQYHPSARTLELSYKEHQANLVECPCCKRKFAPSGAQQHIEICKTVQNRPKNPIAVAV